VSRARTRQRPAVGEPGAVRDRTSRTINLDTDRTPSINPVEFVEDHEATGRLADADDLWLLTVRFGPDIAAAVAAGEIECRRDTSTASWFFRYPEMRAVAVADVTDEMRERFARLSAACCPVACSPAACACPTLEAS
jgi:hypothetical protein